MSDTCVHKYIIPPIKVQWNTYIMRTPRHVESVVQSISWWVGANSCSCYYSYTQNNQSPGFNTDL